MEPSPHSSSSSWLGVLMVLFALLLLAAQGTELLKQTVLAPGSSAVLGIPADCRQDELEEEGLSLEECQLMVSVVRASLSSAPDWFRSLQWALALSACLAAALATAVGVGIAGGRARLNRLAAPTFALLLLLDVIAFVAAVNTGPLLRAQYLWPSLLWFFIHLSFFCALLTRRPGLENT